MDITRTLAAGALGLALLTGAGCGAVAEEAGEKIAEEAIEDSGQCTDVDVESGASGGSFSGSCGGTDIEADSEGNSSIETEDGTSIGTGDQVEVPEGWPADLAVLEGLDVLVTTSDPTTGAYITGSIDGELADVAAQVKADLEAAGFTIDTETTSDVGSGNQATTLTASSGTLTASVNVNETPNDPKGSIGVTYLVAEKAA